MDIFSILPQNSSYNGNLNCNLWKKSVRNVIFNTFLFNIHPIILIFV